MATQIKRTAIAECFNIATTMDHLQRRWLSDDTIVEGMKDSFPQIKKEGSMEQSSTEHFRKIVFTDSAIREARTHLVFYVMNLDTTASGTPLRHIFYFISDYSFPPVNSSRNLTAYKGAPRGFCKCLGSAVVTANDRSNRASL